LLFIRSVQRGLSVDLGYAGRQLLITWVDVKSAMKPTDRPSGDQKRAESTRLRNQITSRLAEHPDVVGAAFGVSTSPFAENQWTWRRTFEVAIDDVARLPPETILLEEVDPAYRSVIGLPLLAGRDLSAADALGAERVALINATMARTLWPAGNALGSRVRVRTGVKFWVPRTGDARIVGIVGDARIDLRRGAVPAVYMPRVQSDGNGAGGGLLYVRTRGTPAAVAAWVRDVTREVVPDEPVHVAQSVGDRIEMLLAPERIARNLLWWFAAVAFLLSGLGVHGLAAHDVARRSREIAIRLALGARPGAIRQLVARVAVLPVIVGIAVGLLTLALLVPPLKAFLFETTPFDPSCWVGAATLLFALGAGAVWWPSRMALRIDPAVTLRAE
jgi:putative ABC transport system permease protein